jgi:teichuronic acid exporter
LSTLKDKAVKGVMWSAIERFGNQGIQFVIGLILARLLMPEDYGLIGMLLVFISVAQVFVEGGFSSALIRKRIPTQSDYSTVFWFNLVISVACYIVLFFSAPLISIFFEEPKLTALARVVGLNIVINSFGIIQKTRLTKNLNFKSQAKINLISILISGLIGVYFAYTGYGVWALVIQNIGRNFMMNAAFWIAGNWRPEMTFSVSSFRELFGFGSKLMLALLLNTISEQLYAIVIGKFYNSKSLGFYTRASQFQKLPVSSIYGAIGAVCYPVLAELQTNETKLKEGYRSMFRLVAFILFPIMVILGVVSKPMIHLVLTDKWLPAVPFLQILCIVGAIYPLNTINIDILKVKGRTDIILKLQVVKQIIYVVMIIICFRWGVMGLVWGEAAVSFIAYYLNTFFSKKLLNYSFTDQLSDLAIFTLISGLMLSFLLVLYHYIEDARFQLFVLPVLGMLLYALLAHIFKVKELAIIKDIARNLLSKRKVVSA